MSDFKQRDMSGGAFANDKRESENHPHFKGSCLIGGVEYWHSIWKKKTKDGATWLSSSFRPKAPIVQTEPVWGSDLPRGSQVSSAADFDDDIAF